MIRTEIKKIIQKTIKSRRNIDLELNQIKIDYPPEGFGDYSTNVALGLAKTAKSNPMGMAEDIKEYLLSGSLASIGEAKLPLFEKIEVIKPGFLNFYLKKEILQDVVAKINKSGERYGDSNMGKRRKVHLDFVSANPTGPVHIGNARGGPLGDVLANVLEKVGFKTFREYYVNDTGAQAEILGHSIIGDKQAQYRGEYIDELRRKILEKDPGKAGEQGVKIILEDIIKPSMEKFGIRFDNWFSEKELQKSGKVDKALDFLKEEKLIYEKDGAFWFRATDFGDDKDRVVVKSNGEKTYFGSDIAYHQEKIDLGFDKLIDIWGSDHHGDVKRIMGAMEALGYKDKLEIILTQFVRVLKEGKEMKMSKRAGTYVSIDDLIEEVGKDATRFFFLMYSPDTHMNFDLDLAKEQSEKNPVYYVQYASARIHSILAKLKVQNSKVKTATRNLKLLNHESELKLIKQLVRFPEIVEDIAKDYRVHRLPHYALDLVRNFHKFYEDCRVIDEKTPELTQARLALVRATQITLKNTLDLMGISAPEKM
jgi:arginyl-tRNA synthetase